MQDMGNGVYRVGGLRRSAVTGRYFSRTPDELPIAGEKETRDWHPDVQPGDDASMHPVYGRRVVPISVNRNWWSYSPEVQRNTLVHELLHVVHNSQTEVIRTAPTSVWQWSTFERETELMVDHLAGVLDKYMPWPITPAEVAEMRAQKVGPFEETP